MLTKPMQSYSRLFVLALVAMCLALPSLAKADNCLPNGVYKSARYGHYGVTSNGLTWSLLPFNSTGSSFNRYAAVGMMLSLEERTAVGQTVRTATMSTMTCSADVIKSDIPTAPGSTKTVSMESVVVVGAVQESPQTFATISIQIFGGTGVLTSNGQNINVDSRTARIALAVSGWQFEDPSNTLFIFMQSEYMVPDLVDYEVTRSHGHPVRAKIQSSGGEAIVTFDEQVFVDGVSRTFTSNFEDEERAATVAMQFPLTVPSGSLIEWAYTSRFQTTDDVEEPIDAPVADNAPTDANTSYEQTAKVVALVLLAVFLVICAAGAVFVVRRFYWNKSEEGRPLREDSSSNDEVELA